MKIKRWLPFLLLAITAVIILLWYIRRTYIDTVYLDGFLFVPLIGHFLDGNWAIGELFARFNGEHLLFGYGVLSLINAKFLSLDMRLDPLIFLVAYASIAAIVYAECSKIFINFRTFIFGIIFIPFGLLCFSLVAPPMMLMSTQFACGSVIALLIAWFLQRIFETSVLAFHKSHWLLIGILVLIPLYFLVFSGAYFPGLVLGLGAMYIFRFALTLKWRERQIMIVAAVILVCVLLYIFFMFWDRNIVSGQRSILYGITQYFSDLSGTIMTYLVGIGGGLMDIHTLESMPVLFLVIGGVMVIIGVVALWLFARTGLYQKTYLPIYCMFYSLGIITAIRVGRGGISDYWIASEWYSFHLRFFAIGVVWILLYAIIKHIYNISTNKTHWFEYKTWPVIFASLALIFIFTCHIYANVSQWNRGPSIHAWLEEKRNALLFPDMFNNTTDVLYWPQEDVDKARIILEKYELSCFSPRSMAAISGNSGDILRFSDWYEDDWIGLKGNALFEASSEGDILFEGYVPEFIANNHVEVLVNNEVVLNGDFAGGARQSFVGSIHKGRNIITITCAQAVAPVSLGINQDIRPLAFYINFQIKPLSK